MMAGTASADLFRDIGNNRMIGGRGRGIRITIGQGPVYRPDYRPYYCPPQPNIVHDAQTGITTVEQPSIFGFLGKKSLGDQNMEIARQTRQASPPTIEELSVQVESIKAMRAEKMRKALEEETRIMELELKKIELQKKLEEAKK